MADSDVFSKLSLDVLFQILLKLPTESLLHLRRVSKSFSPLILHPHFLKLHLLAAPAATRRRHVIYYESTDYTRAYFSFHADTDFSPCKTLETPFKSVHGYLRIVGSDRGVLCLFDTNYFTFVGTVILWNPFVGKFRILPCPRELNCFGSSVSHMCIGFGFDRLNLDFKVVKILYSCDNVPKALIFSFRENVGEAWDLWVMNDYGKVESWTKNRTGVD